MLPNNDVMATRVRKQPPQMGGGDINGALQGLRSAVGYSPPQKPMSAGGLPGQLPALPEKPMGQPGGPVFRDGNELDQMGIDPASPDIQNFIRQMQSPQLPQLDSLSDMEKAGKGDIVNQKAMLELGAPQLQGPPNTGTDFSPPQPPAQDQMQTSFAMQQPSMVGAGGNNQAFGPGRFGGNPPPNVLARRGGVGRGGIMDRRNALNNRMRSRISGVQGLGISPPQQQLKPY